MGHGRLSLKIRTWKPMSTKNVFYNTTGSEMISNDIYLILTLKNYNNQKTKLSHSQAVRIFVKNRICIYDCQIFSFSAVYLYLFDQLCLFQNLTC